LQRFTFEETKINSENVGIIFNSLSTSFFEKYFLNFGRPTTFKNSSNNSSENNKVIFPVFIRSLNSSKLFVIRKQIHKLVSITTRILLITGFSYRFDFFCDFVDSNPITVF